MWHLQIRKCYNGHCYWHSFNRLICNTLQRPMRPAGNARTPPCRQHQRPIRQTRLVCQHPPACRRHTLWQSPRIFSRRPGVLGVKRHNSISIQHSCIHSASCVALRSSLSPLDAAPCGVQAIGSRRLLWRLWLGYELPIHHVFHIVMFPPHEALRCRRRL